jgi:hypothetical protein
VDGIEPQSDDATGGPCLDLVVCSSGPSMPRCTSSINVIPALRFSGAVDLGVVGLGLLGSPLSPSSPVNCGQVENRAEHACSWVATMVRLLREAMAKVG